MRRTQASFVIFLFLASIVTVGIGSASADYENKTHNVDIVPGSAKVDNSRFYNPAIVKINIGDSISWMNLDKDPHTVTDGTPQGEWGKVFDSGLMRQGKEFKFKFTKAGEYPYLCALHPWMLGRVIVVDPVSTSVPSSDINILQKLNVFIHSEKQSYEQDEIVRFTVDVMGAGNMPNDVDKIDAQFGAEKPEPVTLTRIDVGKYVYSVMDLKPGGYNLSVKVSKENFESGSSLLTVYVTKKEATNETPKVEEPTIIIQSDQKQYNAGDLVSISGSVSKIMENKALILHVFDSGNKLHTRGQTQINPNGSFEWTFKVPDKATGTWSVKTKYFDEIVTTSFDILNPSASEAQTSNMKPEKKFKEEKVTIERSVITDQINSQLYSISKGQSVIMQSVIKNNQDTQQIFVYIVQIKDSNGVTVKLEAIEGVLPTEKPFTVGVSWTPEKAGNYTTQVFVWKSLQEPVPLSLNLLNTELSVAG
jgi:plastocyanin